MGTHKERIFIVASAENLRQMYGLTAENRPAITLDKSRIPRALWSLIPDAELLGVADDLIRESIWAQLPEDYKRSAAERIHALASELDRWLGGPEADDPCPSAEYIAFSALRMALDEM